MKVLSIRQPWAWLIVSEKKDIENRGWATNHRGPLLIHASLKFDYDALWWLREQGMPEVLEKVIEHFDIREFYTSNDHGKIAACKGEFGGIVGQVNLDGIVKDSPSQWAMAGCCHWQMSGAKELPFVPMKGKLGLFEVER